MISIEERQRKRTTLKKPWFAINVLRRIDTVSLILIFIIAWRASPFSCVRSLGLTWTTTTGSTTSTGSIVQDRPPENLKS
jgi:hypothetical protein